MGLFSRSAKDPAAFTDLWDTVARASYPAGQGAAERIAAVVDPSRAKRFMHQWEQVLGLLGTPAHASAMRGHPWRGPIAPFGMRRFTLARERAILSGREAASAAIADPARLAAFDTGEVPTPEELLGPAAAPVSWHLRWALSDRGVRVDTPRAGLDERAFGLQPGYDWEGYDPDTVGFDLLVEDESGDDVTPELDAAITAAQGRIWTACGRPLAATLAADPSRHADVTVVVADAWAPLSTSDPDGPQVRARGADLAGLGHEDLADAFTVLGAYGWLSIVAADSPHRSTLDELCARRARVIPEAGRAILGLTD